MYLIDNCGSIFGLETLSLFGDEQKIRQDSSTDSDSVHSYLSTQDSGSKIFIFYLKTLQMKYYL